MEEAEYESRLEHYRLQIERVLEIEEARDAREKVMRAEIEALKVRAESLSKQIFFLKLGRDHG